MMEPSGTVLSQIFRAAAASLLAPVASMVPGTLNVCGRDWRGEGRLGWVLGVGTNVEYSWYYCWVGVGTDSCGVGVGGAAVAVGAQRRTGVAGIT